MQKEQTCVLIVGAGSRSAEAITRVLKTETDYRIVLLSRNTPTSEHDDKLAFYQGDFTVRKQLKDVCLRERPNVIINTAALTNVEYCEINRQEAWNVNVRGVENIVGMCRILDSRMIQLSTDYIFDGAHGPYAETATPNPLNYYGKSKLAAENVCASGNIEYAIVRTNVLYGATMSFKPDFVIKISEKLQQKQEFGVVNDQFHNPTLIDDLAYAIKKLIVKRRQGIYNVAGSEYLNRYEFATAIARTYGLDENLIKAITTESLKPTVERPLKAGLVTLKAETDLGINFSNVADGLTTMRRQMQLFGYREWKL